MFRQQILRIGAVSGYNYRFCNRKDTLQEDIVY
jgi:hypothetical protein